jgi:hypothetical protein
LFFFFFFPLERSWIEQGCKVGDQIIPLARNFNGVSTDIESQNVPLVRRMVIPFTLKSNPSAIYMFGTSTL